MHVYSLCGEIRKQEEPEKEGMRQKDRKIGGGLEGEKKLKREFILIIFNRGCQK